MTCLVVGSGLMGVAIFLEEQPVLPNGGVYAEVVVDALHPNPIAPDDLAGEAQAVFHSDQVTHAVVAQHGGDPDTLIGDRVALIPERHRWWFRVVARADDEGEAIALVNDTAAAFVRAASDSDDLNLGDRVMLSQPQEVPVPGETTHGDPPPVPSLAALAVLTAGLGLCLRDDLSGRNQELPTG